MKRRIASWLRSLADRLEPPQTVFVASSGRIRVNGTEYDMTGSEWVPRIPFTPQEER